VYVRGRMHEASRAWAVLAVAPGENTAAVEGILAFGILWLDWTRNHLGRHAVEGLRLFIPEGASRFLRERIVALSSAASQSINGIHALALHVPPAGNEISTRLVPGTNDVAPCFRGLQFGVWSKDGISFGLGDFHEKLTPATEPSLDRLMRRLDLHRSPHTSEMNHSLYRTAPDRWLETLVLADHTKLDARLDPNHLYSRVPAVAAGDRGVLDLLGVTRRGRLVVIELKASEDLQLAVQAVDYWLRVRRRQREGDFERYGYFAGVVLDPKPLLVWLAAPSLRFHSATETLFKYLSPEIQVTRVGLTKLGDSDRK
jgi:hypothetical protein